MPSHPSDLPDHRPVGEFDTSGELWDRIVDDITRQGSPCLDTVQALVEEACQHPPRTEPPKDQEG